MIERNITSYYSSFRERYRIQGNFSEAIRLARRNSEIDPTDIVGLPQEQLTPLMQLWRILTVSLMSCAGKEWNGDKAAKLLLEARRVFQNYL